MHRYLVGLGLVLGMTVSVGAGAQPDPCQFSIATAAVEYGLGIGYRVSPTGQLPAYLVGDTAREFAPGPAPQVVPMAPARPWTSVDTAREYPDLRPRVSPEPQPASLVDTARETPALRPSEQLDAPRPLVLTSPADFNVPISLPMPSDHPGTMTTGVDSP